MNNDQITALAREYAEEGAEEVGLPNCLQNETLGLVATETECVIKWLLRRFALVEKENIKRYFQSRNYILTHQDKYEVYIVRESEVEMKLLRCLFPEIAKEVEG